MEEEKGEKSEERCQECDIAVAIGMALNICKDVGTKEDCDNLYKLVMSNEISPKELFKIIKEHAKDNSTSLDHLKYLEELSGLEKEA